ncbi:hypothetical protein RHMOL_Rhmol01G0153000 [Rhododendron molle]|uniref:Uncharacterized protein n=1 Tax=Rhododendron molle TaxID=49168 RepID=A0ACC0Q1G2_RHOML|nr:hypothetical protein RHMOL_Rhmol01G0153000 [Rhododendron molle]
MFTISATLGPYSPSQRLYAHIHHLSDSRSVFTISTALRPYSPSQAAPCLRLYAHIHHLSGSTPVSTISAALRPYSPPQRLCARNSPTQWLRLYSPSQQLHWL